ncbi:protein kinase domain-containing protein [Archangium sp.]|uniref:serine/threonine-protein kinase n=1 Tax=Archangium sp. TaxID=1872627 RepID=UPI003899A91A
MAGSKLPLAPDDVRGRQMGNYEVLCRLSTGGMAEILLATRRGLAGFHKPVVLKKILPDIHDQEEFVQMFLDEARVTAAFNHPNIAQVFDLDVAGDELFLAMEFVPGATLLEVAKVCLATHEPMPMGFALAAARDTALALHYAHTFTDALGQPSPVIHRDVAEKNIMVTYEGVTKLLDFGIAKNLAGASRTQVGMVKGTSGYMSPEQILGEPLDARSDLFSLGVVLHECLTGMRLFPGKAPAAVGQAVLRNPIPEPSRINKALPAELDALVLKALARKRDDRYATTLEFARELERAVGPLIWLPEQSGELLRRLFAERREQTRQLLARGRPATGEVKLAQHFSDKDAPATPPPAPAPAGAAPRTPTPAAGQATPSRTPPGPRLPSVSAPHFPSPTPAVVSEETELALVSYSVVTKPPAQLIAESQGRAVPPPPPPATPPPPPPEDTQVRRAAQPPARARPARGLVAEPPTQLNAPTLEPARPSIRTPVPPETPRAATPEPVPARRGPSRSEAPPPAPEEAEEGEVDLKTAVMRAPRATGEQPVTPDETLPRYNPTRPARKSPSHLDAVTTPAPAPLPERSTNLDGPTVPVMRSPFAPPLAEEPDSDAVEFRTAPSLPPVMLEGETTEEDTSPSRLRPGALEPTEEDPEDYFPTASGHPPPPAPARSGRGVLVAALLLLLLAGGAAALVALRMDGGLLSSRLFPPQPPAPAALKQAPPAQPEAQVQPAPAAEPPPASAPPAEAQLAQPAQTSESQAPQADAPPAQARAEAPPAQAPEPPPAQAEAKPAPAPAQPEALAAAPRAEIVAKDEASSPSKRAKAAAGSRRKQQRGATSTSPTTDADTAPEQVMNADEANQAWQALERERSGPSEPSADKGFLTLATEPYAKVYLGSRSLGGTPLFRVPLPPGKYALRLVGPDGKPLKLLTEIKAGQVTSIRGTLSKLAQE